MKSYGCNGLDEYRAWDTDPDRGMRLDSGPPQAQARGGRPEGGLRKKDMELSKQYVSEFRTFIAEPLQREVGELRMEVNQLRYALQKIGDCPHSGSCPVYDELQRQSKGSDC